MMLFVALAALIFCPNQTFIDNELLLLSMIVENHVGMAH
jgi:hypothetical protein